MRALRIRSAGGAGSAVALGSSEDAAELSASDLTVTYANGARAVAGVTLRVSAGSIIAILGRNGAGKSSTLRGISGFLPSERVATSGKVTVHGVDISGAPPVRSYREGVVLVPERDKVFPGLKVWEHFYLATGKKSPPEKAVEVFEALGRRMESKAGLLSGGERQMLALAMAWSHDPRVLLVDEISLGLAPVIVKALMRQLRRMCSEDGMSVVLVEQDATAALGVADYVYVLDRGEVAWEGTGTDTSAAALSRQFLGV